MRPGCSSAGPASAMAGPVTTSAATTMAMTRPDEPLNRRPVARLSRMYAAQPAAATRANAMPAACVLRPSTGPARAIGLAEVLVLLVSRAPPSVSSRTPAAARITQSTSSHRRDEATATASGPRNSIVTATPSGIRANDW